MFGKRNLAALAAEFLGAGILTVLVLSVQRSTIGVPFFVAAAAGLTVAMLVFVFANTSGAHFNPAVTISQWTTRRITTVRAILYVAAQLLGAFVAYYLYTYFVNNKLQSIGGEFTARIMFAEAAGALVLGFAWAAAVYQRFSIGTTAAVVGIGYMIAIVAASAASIGLVNPALALGVKAWVWGTYVAGPIIGAVVGFNLYAYLFANENIKTTFAGATAALTGKKPVAKKSASKKKK